MLAKRSSNTPLLHLERPVALRHRADDAQALAPGQVAGEAERLDEGRHWQGGRKSERT